MTNEKEAIIIAMLEDLLNLVKGAKAPQIDLAKIEQLADQMQQNNTSADETITKMGEVIEEARKPVIKENKHTLGIESKGIFSLIIGLPILLVILSVMYYIDTQPNYNQRDNDLKYRYIKMKGESSPKFIYELEDTFEIDRDNEKIDQIYKDVKDYEEAVQKRAIAEEQARLKQLEAEKQNNKAKSLKDK